MHTQSCSSTRYSFSSKTDMLSDCRNIATHLKYYACPKDMEKRINGRLYIFDVTKPMCNSLFSIDFFLELIIKQKQD